MYVGTDIGGTFTDLVGYDAERGVLLFGKTLTTPHDLAEGVVQAMNEVGITPQQIAVLKHGTTQVINTLLERTGALTALVTTEGFADTLEIGRAGRPKPFDLSYARTPALVPRRLRFEVKERIDGRGEILAAPDNAELEALAERLAGLRLGAVAVAFINSYRNPANETTVAEFLRARLPGVYVTASFELSREWFEYERASTAASNAYVGPRASGYLEHFDRRLGRDGFSGTFFMMGSNGGTLSLARASEQPIALVESGPIGGCIGTAAYAKTLGLEKVIAFDMGGTTAKCALIEHSAFEVHGLYYVGGYDYGFPIQTPVIDIVEVGTGGGSIAYVDKTQRVHVGPRSAGADPGPVCFGRGGYEPTVTDANLVLGRIGSGAFLDGSIQLDTQAAREAVMSGVGRPLGYESDERAGDVAGGIVALANAQMATSMKELTIERGKTIGEFTLFTFGGGGPLHGASLARELGIRKMIVPPEPGNFSAIGMLLADARVDESCTFFEGLGDALTPAFQERFGELEERIRLVLERDFPQSPVVLERQVEMRYTGQRHSLRIVLNGSENAADIAQAFRSGYSRRYGNATNAAAEFVALLVTGFALTDRPELDRLHRAAPVGTMPAPHASRQVSFGKDGSCLTPVYTRMSLPLGYELEGPAVIEEFSSTTVIGPGDRLRVGTLGQLEIDVA